LVSGGEEGIVRLFDLQSRAILRQFDGHKKYDSHPGTAPQCILTEKNHILHFRPVRVARFATDNLHIMSGSDDNTVRNWDISTGQQLAQFNGHSDQIRCGAVSPTSNDLWISGSYDHTVKLWDTRSNQCVTTIEHGAPVEDLLVFPGGGILVTAGGREVKIWDLMGGFRLLETLSNHHKTVTCLGYDSWRSRLFSGSLDHQVKIYDTTTYKVAHSIKYNAPILSVAISPASTHLVVGTTDGMLNVRHRVASMEEQASQKEQRRQFSSHSWRYLLRGRDEFAPPTALKIERGRRKKLHAYDQFLRKFQYKKALDAALETKNPVVIVSMFEEFMRRKALWIPLSGRTEETLMPVLQFLEKYVTNPTYASTLLPVADHIVALYQSILGQSPQIDDMFKKIDKKLQGEIKFQKQLTSLMGVRASNLSHGAFALY
jgi:U3 small nucleolar RNA-associated protein 15